MPILSSPGVLRRLLLPVLLLSAAPVALAQVPTDTVVPSAAQDNDPAELLARALRTLQAEPRNLEALTAAGQNALLLGDSNAAVGFFGRAQEIAPRDGRVKAGLGSALVQLEKPQDALRLFADASRLGVPDVEFAADRGLAYDLTGDPKRAQRDYALVLAAHPDDDTTRRRLALSQGISGRQGCRAPDARSAGPQEGHRGVARADLRAGDERRHQGRQRHHPCDAAAAGDDAPAVPGAARRADARRQGARGAFRRDAGRRPALLADRTRQYRHAADLRGGAAERSGARHPGDPVRAGALDVAGPVGARRRDAEPGRRRPL